MNGCLMLEPTVKIQEKTVLSKKHSTGKYPEVVKRRPQKLA